MTIHMTVRKRRRIKIRNAELDDLRLCLLRKEFSGFSTIRSTFPYLEDRKPVRSRAAKKKKAIRSREKIGRFVNSLFRLNWSEGAIEKNVVNFLKRFKIPYAKEGKYLCVQKTDILELRRDWAVGPEEIATYLEIHRSTLSRWMKDRRYRKMPVVRGKTIYANKLKLRQWRLLTIARNLGLE